MKCANCRTNFQSSSARRMALCKMLMNNNIGVAGTSCQAMAEQTCSFPVRAVAAREQAEVGTCTKRSRSLRYKRVYNFALLCRQSA